MIRGPKDAVPTHRGWVHPRTGELLKSQRITDAQLAEWHGHSVSAPEPAIQTLHEAPVVESFVEPEVVDFHYEEDDLDQEEE